MDLKTNVFNFNHSVAALSGCGDFQIAPMQLTLNLLAPTTVGARINP